MNVLMEAAARGSHAPTNDPDPEESESAGDIAPDLLLFLLDQRMWACFKLVLQWLPGAGERLLWGGEPVNPEEAFRLVQDCATRKAAGIQSGDPGASAPPVHSAPDEPRVGEEEAAMALPVAFSWWLLVLLMGCVGLVMAAGFFSMANMGYEL